MRISQSSGHQLTRVRHFIGRLGYWHKASLSLVRHSWMFADIIRSARVESIGAAEGYDPKPKLDQDLERLALRVFPNFRSTPLCTALVHSISRSRDELVYDRPLECRPHAEAVVIDWFYSQRAKFVNDDRYVGCSKRSCFCCSLYIKLHPAKMQERPSHGNIWVQWRFPRSLSLSEKTNGDNTEEWGMIMRMTGETRHITQNMLTNAASFPRQRFESTTGMSASVIQSGMHFMSGAVLRLWL